MRWLDDITHWTNNELEQALGFGDGQGAWCVAVYGITKSQT